jgi:hypothetical protein
MKKFNETSPKSLRTSQRLKEDKKNWAGCNDNKFLSKVHYKGFLLQLPPVALNKDRQYEFMKNQIQEYLPSHEYDAAIKFICDVLDY